MRSAAAAWLDVECGITIPPSTGGHDRPRRRFRNPKPPGANRGSRPKAESRFRTPYRLATHPNLSFSVSASSVSPRFFPIQSIPANPSIIRLFPDNPGCIRLHALRSLRFLLFN